MRKQLTVLRSVSSSSLGWCCLLAVLSRCLGTVSAKVPQLLTVVALHSSGWISVRLSSMADEGLWVSRMAAIVPSMGFFVHDGAGSCGIGLIFPSGTLASGRWRYSSNEDLQVSSRAETPRVQAVPSQQDDHKVHSYLTDAFLRSLPPPPLSPLLKRIQLNKTAKRKQCVVEMEQETGYDDDFIHVITSRQPPKKACRKQVAR